MPADLEDHTIAYTHSRDRGIAGTGPVSGA